MRLTGPRRGNPTLRFMIEQTARRRMAAGPMVERERTRAGTQSDVLRWSREFFERVHATLLPRTSHVADTAEGQLRYYGSKAMSMWAFVSRHATALAYDHAETPAQIHERALRWLACLTTRTAPGLASAHWGHPIYGARLDPASGEVDVVWAVPGEWCEAVLTGALPEREWDAPRSWQAELAETAG